MLKKVHTVWRQMNTFLEDALGQKKALKMAFKL